MKDEALRLALEALQKIYIAPEHEEYIRVWWPACEEAITAIKQALANDALDKMAENERELGIQMQPEPEPVADPEKHPQFYTWTWDEWVSGGKWLANFGWKKPKDKVTNLQPLYTSPPKREWQGLTDEEMHECWGDPLTPLGMKHARMIEAKLKEKNHG